MKGSACKGGVVWQILSRYRIGYIGFNRYRIGNLWISPIPIYRYYRQALGSPIPITDMVKVADIGIGYSPNYNACPDPLEGGQKPKTTAGGHGKVVKAGQLNDKLPDEQISPGHAGPASVTYLVASGYLPMC